MVGSDLSEVEARRTGELACPCGEVLAPWGVECQRADRPRRRGAAAASGALRRVPAYACVVGGVVPAAAGRRGGCHRRGVADEGRRRGASADR